MHELLDKISEKPVPIYNAKMLKKRQKPNTKQLE